MVPGYNPNQRVPQASAPVDLAGQAETQPPQQTQQAAAGPCAGDGVFVQ